MLTHLKVENYALIETLHMELDGKLNIITGETGAGKSILLGALGLLMGAKNDGSATRDNTKSCIIEGQFSIAGLNLRPLFEQMDWEWEESIAIRRVITAGGKSRAFVGDIPVSLGDLRTLTTRLIDIHSQHQNQILGDERFRIRAIDLLYDSAPLQQQYSRDISELQSLRTELQRVEEIAATARRDYEWLSHQVEELSSANLREGECAEAEAEAAILQNAEAISETLHSFTAAADGDSEHAIIVTLKRCEREMTSIGESYPSAAEYAARLGSVVEELKDLNRTIEGEAESIEANPARLELLTERVDTLYSLCQKHRAADERELIEIRDSYAEQLLTIENSEEQRANLRRQIAQSEKSAWETAHKISEARRSVAPQFEAEITSTLHRLGMEQARFSVECRATEQLHESGCDNLLFLFSAVEGRTMQGVEKIASGGETSRVMLALKSLLARRMELPTIIFDEIDTGVSGRIADVMGEIIEELSASMQVIDITHLPQIASKGTSHFEVYKEGGHTNITRLTADERVTHIATMLSGESITDAAMEQARILLRR